MGAKGDSRSLEDPAHGAAHIEHVVDAKIQSSVGPIREIDSEACAQIDHGQNGGYGLGVVGSIGTEFSTLVGWPVVLAVFVI